MTDLVGTVFSPKQKLKLVQSRALLPYSTVGEKEINFFKSTNYQNFFLSIHIHA